MQSILADAPSGPDGWDRFGYANRVSHDLINRTLLTRNIAALPYYVLYPIEPGDWLGFLERHSLVHQQMDRAVGAISTDLSALDYQNLVAVKAWIELHWLEHQTVETALGISS